MRKENKRNVEISGNKFKEMFLKNGYKLIGFCFMAYENTFIFETEIEADRAYKEFEKEKDEIVGWWYCKEDFLPVLEHFEKKYYEIPVKWFDEIDD